MWVSLMLLLLLFSEGRCLGAERVGAEAEFGGSVGIVSNVVFDAHGILSVLSSFAHLVDVSGLTNSTVLLDLSSPQLLLDDEVAAESAARFNELLVEYEAELRDSLVSFLATNRVEFRVDRIEVAECASIVAVVSGMQYTTNSGRYVFRVMPRQMYALSCRLPAKDLVDGTRGLVSCFGYRSGACWYLPEDKLLLVICDEDTATAVREWWQVFGGEAKGAYETSVPIGREIRSAPVSSKQ